MISLKAWPSKQSGYGNLLILNIKSTSLQCTQYSAILKIVEFLWLKQPTDPCEKYKKFSKNFIMTLNHWLLIAHFI